MSRPRAARRELFRIGDQQIAPGERLTVDLPVSVLSDHTPVSMGVHVIHGKRPGPTFFVSSGVHGDEIIGTEIVRRLLRVRQLNSVRGTLLIVPIVNAFGFINRSRYLPDRRDLNRCFPGTAGGSLAARLAHLFSTEIIARSQYGIDLHSAAVHRTNLPQVRVTPGDSAALRLAKVFGAPAIVSSSLRDGSLRATAAQAGVTTLLLEAGEGLRFDEYAARVGVMGILRVLRHVEMVSARGITAPKRAPLICPKSGWVRSPAGGLLRSYVEQGQVVAAGDTLAVVSDPFGDHEWPVLATGPGLVIGRAVMPVVNEGDAIFHIGELRRGIDAESALEDLAAQLEEDAFFDEDDIL